MWSDERAIFELIVNIQNIIKGICTGLYTHFISGLMVTLTTQYINGYVYCSIDYVFRNVTWLICGVHIMELLVVYGLLYVYVCRVLSIQTQYIQFAKYQLPNLSAYIRIYVDLLLYFRIMCTPLNVNIYFFSIDIWILYT